MKEIARINILWLTNENFLRNRFKITVGMYVSRDFSFVAFVSGSQQYPSSVQYSTVQYSKVQYSTVQYSTVQYSTVQYPSSSTVQYSTLQYSTVPFFFFFYKHAFNH